MTGPWPEGLRILRVEWDLHERTFIVYAKIDDYRREGGGLQAWVHGVFRDAVTGGCNKECNISLVNVPHMIQTLALRDHTDIPNDLLTLSSPREPIPWLAEIISAWLIIGAIP